MVRSRSDGRRSPKAPRHRVLVLAVLVLLLPPTSCANMFTGSTQLVPVTSTPEPAEVFVDGVSLGLTPVELRLPRNADVTVATSALGSESSAQSVKATVGLLGLTLASLLVDYGTGALFQLRPGEIVAVFE